MHAEKCPVCKGRGVIVKPGGFIECNDPSKITVAEVKAARAKIEMQKCHGCDGKGWVSVGDEKPSLLLGEFMKKYATQTPEPIPTPFYYPRYYPGSRPPWW